MAGFQSRDQRRWMRPNAHLYIRPDAYRFMRPGAPRHIGRDVVKYFWPEITEPAPSSGERKSDVLAQVDTQRDWEARYAITRERWRITALRFQLALLRLSRQQKALHPSHYDPNQPRVPKGNPDGGQWTQVAGPGGGRAGRFGGYFPGATPGQLLRLDRTIARTQEALTKIRLYDPNWQPRSVSMYTPGSIEGEIRHNEARAIEAEGYLHKLRTGVGGNFGPSIDATPWSTGNPPPQQAFDGTAWIRAYRAANNMPDLFGQPSWPFDRGTVAVTEVDGKLIFGVNARAPGYSDAEWNAAQRTRDILIGKFPQLDVGNPGWWPNDAFFHAEATILFRAANLNGGTLAGKTLQVYVDRDVCSGCEVVLPTLSSKFGDPTVTFTNGRTGSMWRLENRVLKRIND